MKDKFTFQERRRLTKGRWWVPLLKLIESYMYSPFKPTESYLLTNERVIRVNVWFFWVCRCVRERETRERTGVVLVIWKSEVGPGQPRGRCVLNFYLRLSQMFVYKYPLTDLLSSFFFFFWIKISMFLKTCM